MVLPVLGLLAGAAAMAGGGMYASRKMGDRMDLAQTERERDALGARMGGALDAAGRPQGNTGSMWDVGASLARSGVEENLAPFFAQETQLLGHQQGLQRIGAQGAQTRANQANAHALTLERMRIGQAMEQEQADAAMANRVAALESIEGNPFHSLEAREMAANEKVEIAANESVRRWEEVQIANGNLPPRAAEGPPMSFSSPANMAEMAQNINMVSDGMDYIDQAIQLADAPGSMPVGETQAIIAGLQTTAMPALQQLVMKGGALGDEEREFVNALSTGKIDSWFRNNENAIGVMRNVQKALSRVDDTQRAAFGMTGLDPAQAGVVPRYSVQPRMEGGVVGDVVGTTLDEAAIRRRGDRRR